MEYSHFLPELRQEAAEEMDFILNPVVQSLPQVKPKA